MANYDLKWTLPSVAANQRALKNVVIDVRQVGTTTWTNATVVPVPTTTLVATIGPGNWEYRCTVVDVGNVASLNPKIATVNVPVPLVEPGDVSTFTITPSVATPTISVVANGPNAVTVTLLP